MFLVYIKFFYSKILKKSLIINIYYMIFKFNDFINEKAMGISLPSISYSKLVYEKVLSNFLTFVNGSEQKLSKQIVISKFEINTKIKDKNRKYLSDYPICKFEINLKFKKSKEGDTVRNRRHFIKNGYLISAGAHNFGEAEDDSRILNNEIIFNMYVDITIDPGKFKILNGSYVSEEFKNYLESTIWHELNHNYELWSKMKKNKSAKTLPVSVTWADKNSWGIPKEVFKQWNREFLFFIYTSEPHEIRAIIQEIGFYINKKHKIDNENLSYQYILKMREFSPKFLIDHMKKVILETTGTEVDYQYILERLKNMWISNYKQQLKTNLETDRIRIEKIEKMSAEEFISFFGKRINKAGEYMFRKVHKMIGNLDI